jgi:hypothetical protein
LFTNGVGSLKVLGLHTHTINPEYIREFAEIKKSFSPFCTLERETKDIDVNLMKGGCRKHVI